MISKITNRIIAKKLIHVTSANFAGTHHKKLFDWRDDHDLNPFYEEDPRRVGTQDPFEYSYPFEGKSP